MQIYLSDVELILQFKRFGAAVLASLMFVYNRGPTVVQPLVVRVVVPSGATAPLSMWMLLIALCMHVNLLLIKVVMDFVFLPCLRIWSMVLMSGGRGRQHLCNL